MSAVDRTQARRLLRQMVQDINEKEHPESIAETLEILKTRPDYTLRVEPYLRPIRIRDIVAEETGNEMEMD